MPNKRFLFGYTFMFLIFMSYIYFGGISGAISFLLALIFYSAISYLIHRIWKYLRNSTALDFKVFLNIFVYKISIFAFIILSLLGSFMYYQNNISPAQMPQYTLTNGEQTIVFQAMSHIASEEFYKKVQGDIRGYKQQDYVLYFEGVQAGSEENSEDFNTALGINFEPDLYDNFSKLYGVVAQDNSIFLGLENNLDYNIDISIDEIMEIYNEKTVDVSDTQQESFLQSGEVQDVNSLLLEQLSKLSGNQLTALRYINQSLLNFMIKQEGLRNIIVEKVANQDLFSVILDERNNHIVNEINQREDKKIFIMYGLMHFAGVLDLLQSQDPNWKIINTSYSQLIIQ